MSFQGSLRELQLPDVIQLVSASGKTGKFTLVRGEERGTLFLKQGRIIHAEVGDLSGEEAVHVLASWSSGEFQFLPGAESLVVSIHKSNARLLMEAAHQHDEWRVLSRKVPGLDFAPTLASAEAGRPVTLSPIEWSLIVRIDGKKTVRELARESGSSSFEVAKLLYGLVTADLVVMQPPRRERTPSGPGEEKRILEILCMRIQQEAELALGEESPPALQRAYRRALAQIERGAGLEALRALVSETEKAISSRRGAAPSKAFQEKMPVLLQPKA
ncbi:MAG TPA: DUF4388 domain-containing protein [Thermoanaerobaculia bacterium]